MTPAANATELAALELVAELVVLERYDDLRTRLGHDFGGGQRAMELSRRRRVVLELAGGIAPLVRLERELDPADLTRAYGRVGAARCRRARLEAERYGSRGVLTTRACWNQVEREYGPGSTA